MHIRSYDYTPALLRIDPTIPAVPARSISSPEGGADFAAQYAGEFAATRPVISQIWTELSPSAPALASMLSVLDAFIAYARRHGTCSWTDTTTDLVAAFVLDTDDELTGGDVSHLRKNSLHAAFLALIDADLYDEVSPAEGILPIDEPKLAAPTKNVKADGKPKPKTRCKYSERTHVRPATHDEIMLIRLAARFAGTNRAQHLPAAAVAMCTSTATTSEAPQVLWQHLTTNAATSSLVLAGRIDETHDHEKAIAPRTVTLDPWCADALQAWRAERSEVRAVDPASSVVYAGAKSLLSNSAQVSTDRQIAKVLEIADLRHLEGLTAGSLRLWAATRHVTDLSTLVAGAAAADVDPLTLHRHITQQGDRALLRRLQSGPST